MRLHGRYGLLGMFALAVGAGLAVVALLGFGQHGSAVGVGAGRVSPAAGTGSAAGSRGSVAAAYARMPLSFEPNRGQFDRRALYAAQGAGYTLFLTHSGATMSLAAAGSSQASGRHSKPGRQGVLRIALTGADSRARVTPVGELPGKVSYLIGDDRSKWHTGIPTYSAVRYRDVWPGIGARFYGRSGQLEYDFDVAAGADPGQIGLTLSGEEGVTVERGGSLLVKLPGGHVRQLVPRAWQQTPGGRRPVSAHYRLHTGGRVTIRLGRHDPHRPLVVDPVLLYATYLGGTDPDEANGVSAIPGGGAWVTGVTHSNNFPTHGAGGGTLGGYQDAFVAKFDAANQLVYADYLGGDPNSDYGTAISATADGGAWVTGRTTGGFPVTGDAAQHDYAGPMYHNDAFAARLTSTGHLEYATYLGGDGNDEGKGVSATSGGGAWITGATTSGDFPVPGGAQDTNGGGFSDAFAVKLAADGALDYGTYLGGPGSDSGSAVSATAGGGAWVTGETSSDNFPGINSDSFQDSKRGTQDAFAVKLGTNGALDYATYLGGGSVDLGTGIAATADGGAWITGTTHSNDFPATSGAFRGGTSDAFAFKLTADGKRAYGTYLGGSDTDNGQGISVAPGGGVWITGDTKSDNFPVTDGTTLHDMPPTGGDAFAVRLNASGHLGYATYLGGTSILEDVGTAVSATAGGGAWIAGRTGADDFPATPDAAQHMHAGGLGTGDAFVARLGEPIVITKTASAAHIAPGGTLAYTLHVGNRSHATLTGAHVTDDLSNVLTHATWADHLHSSIGTPHYDPGDHTLHWTGNLPAQGSATITYHVHVHTGLTGGLLTNAAGSPNGAVCEHAPSRLSPCTTVTPIIPEAAPGGTSPDLLLVLTKVASVPAAHPGDQITYQLLVRNEGHAAATGVVIEDATPSGLRVTHTLLDQGSCHIGAIVTCHLGAIRAGGEALVHVTARLALDATGSIVNRATVNADQASSHPESGVASSHVRVIPRREPSGGGENASGGGHHGGANHGGNQGGGNRGSGANARSGSVTQPTSDLVVTGQVSRTGIRRGERVTYTFTVTNRGPNIAHNVQLGHAIRLPANVISVRTSQGTCTTTRPIVCMLGTLATGASATVQIQVLATVAGDQLISAGASSDSRDPHPPTAVARLAHPIIPIPDITIDADPATIHAGQTSVLHIHVSNINGLTLHQLSTCITLPSDLVYPSPEPGATTDGNQRCWPLSHLQDADTENYTTTVRELPIASAATARAFAASTSDLIAASVTARHADTAHDHTRVTVIRAAASTPPPPPHHHHGHPAVAG